MQYAMPLFQNHFLSVKLFLLALTKLYPEYFVDWTIFYFGAPPYATDQQTKNKYRMQKKFLQNCDKVSILLAIEIGMLRSVMISSKEMKTLQRLQT